MKTLVVTGFRSASAVIVLLALFARLATAQITAAPGASPPVSNDASATVHLSYGVADVVKLSEARVGEDAIVAFIANSGATYNLSVNEIIYLKNRGLSDRVITAMLEQRQKVAAAAAPSAPAASPAPATQNSTYANPSGSEYAPTTTQPATTSSQTAPASTVYTIPNYSSTYVYPSGYPYYSYPYYGGYYGYGYPAISVGFGFGSGWCGNGWFGGCSRGGWGGCWGGPHGGFCGAGWHGGFHR
jgi:hypothetical protein